MATKVFNNVEDHRLLDGSTIVEDVTSVGLPTIEHQTTDFENISGMSMDITMPNMTRLKAMEFTVSHNNGANSHLLAVPGKHMIEFRLARQRFDVAKSEMAHESVKYRITALHISTEKGDVETGNPLGSTDKFAVLRYEEIVAGKQTVLIDGPSGIVKFNGKNYTDAVQSLLK